MTMNYEEVKKDFLSGKIKGCKTYFENNNYYVEAGYCCIVLDELDKAKELFQKVQEVDTRAKWGLILLQMIKGDILTFPTYFQIRNFLELDLSILILYCKGEYVEKIILNTRRLSSLTGNILLLSKLENQSIPPEKNHFSLDEQIRQSIVESETVWDKKR